MYLTAHVQVARKEQGGTKPSRKLLVKSRNLKDETFLFLFPANMKDFYLRDKIPEDVKEAIWQYFLDHSQLQKNGYWGIMFYTKGERDFWQRVQARYLGEFKRYDAEEKNAKQRARFDALDRQKREALDWHKKVLKAKDGNLLDRSILRIYKRAREYILNK